MNLGGGNTKLMKTVVIIEKIDENMRGKFLPDISKIAASVV